MNTLDAPLIVVLLGWILRRVARTRKPVFTTPDDERRKVFTLYDEIFKGIDLDKSALSRALAGRLIKEKRKHLDLIDEIENRGVVIMGTVPAGKERPKKK